MSLSLGWRQINRKPALWHDYSKRFITNTHEKQIQETIHTEHHKKTTSDSQQTYQHILSGFKAPIRFAFAYGSAVYPQKNQIAETSRLVDLVLVVNHPEHWHWINMQHNSHHYSGLKYLGAHVVSFVQNGFGAGVYYNANVVINGTKLKYGVISTEKLCSDLRNWDTLYISGRMHKPIRVIRDDKIVHDAQKFNLENALRTALLLLPAEFRDVRMSIAENPNKVANIVAEQHRHFRHMYEPLVDKNPHVSYMRGAYLKQDVGRTARIETISSLPKNLLKNLVETARTSEFENLRGGDLEIITKIADSPKLSLMLTKVSSTSLSQSLKGVLTGGILTSLKYSCRKISKRFSQ